MPERNGVIDFLVKLPVDKQEACGKQITLEISKDKKLLEKLNKAVSRLRSRYEVCLVSAAKKAKIPPNEARGDTKLQNTNESHDTPASLTSPSSNEPPEAQASETLFHPQNDEPKSSDLEMSPSCPLNEPLDQPSNHAISAPPLHQPSSINDESMVVLAAASISSYEHYFSELLATAVSGYQYVQLAAAATESAQDVHYLVLEVVPDKIKQMAEVLCGVHLENESGLWYLHEESSRVPAETRVLFCYIQSIEDNFGECLASAIGAHPVFESELPVRMGKVHTTLVSMGVPSGQDECGNLVVSLSPTKAVEVMDCLFGGMCNFTQFPCYGLE